jgi:hypothetical protein
LGDGDGVGEADGDGVRRVGAAENTIEGPRVRKSNRSIGMGNVGLLGQGQPIG